MTTQRPMPPWAGLIFLLIGAYIILLATGVLPYAPMTRRKGLLDGPQHWQVASAGLAFFCAGIAVGFQNRKHWLLKLNGWVATLAILAPLGWLFLFSGQVDLGVVVLVGLVLGVVAISVLLGWLRARQSQGVSTEQTDDPLAEAQVYVHYGRVAQARAVLTQAKVRYPARAAEFQRMLDTL